MCQPDAFIHIDVIGALYLLSLSLSRAPNILLYERMVCKGKTESEYQYGVSISRRDSVVPLRLPWSFVPPLCSQSAHTVDHVRVNLYDNGRGCVT